MRNISRRQLGQLSIAAFIPNMPLQSTGARRYRYLHADVFTDRAFEGNQLLVFVDPAGLSVDAMHTMTRESNYSECTFVFPPEQAGTDHRVRIFTRNGEVPFAGHPTIGTAFALATSGAIKPGTPKTTFGLGVGPTAIDLEWDGPRLKFAWMTQLKPTFGKTVNDTAALAAALGVEAAQLATTRAPAQEVNSGSTFFIVPMASRQAVDAAVLDRAKMNAVFAAAGIQPRGAYVFSTERGQDNVDAYTRLVGSGGIEDPATGSAAGPAGCFMVRHRFVPAAQAAHLVFLQGVLVKRPSRLHVNVTASDTGGSAPLEVSGVKVGGPAVIVGEGYVTSTP
ncbi:MAG TPA: PhzF family phenazine biosynthesis protein [Vicinamibacterales bacterium]